MSDHLRGELVFWAAVLLGFLILGSGVWGLMVYDRHRCEASGRQLYHLGRSSICAYPHERVSDLARPS